MKFLVIKLTFVAVISASAGLGSMVISPTAAAKSREVPQAAPTRRALLIGISKYNAPIPTLPYPLNDVARIEELLSSPRYEFKKENIHKLTDDATSREDLPTRENILNAIKKYLIDDAKPGDSCFLYYSGHGSWVKNKASDEDDKRDETIVPMDAVRPSKPVKSFAELKDIRDKELVDLYNVALDNGVILTVILDSCHSGSAAKGEYPGKDVPGIEGFDLNLAPTDDQLKKPEDRGALILTAAKDYEIAGGGEIDLNGQYAKYSYFTANLLKTLYRTPADLISAEGLFAELHARMMSESRITQTPEIGGTEMRRAQTIFGGATKETTGRVKVVVKEKTDDTHGFLHGSVIDGLEQGVELERIIPAEPKVRIRVTKADISQSEYQVIGPPQTIKVGDRFEQVTWVTRAGPDLTVWLPSSASPILRKAVTTDLAQNKGQIIVTDTREKADYELSGRSDPKTQKFEYSWRLCKTVAAASLSLPQNTDWISDDGSGSAAGGLKILAFKLAKIRRLTNLRSPIPIGGSIFPYRLEVRNSKTKQRILPGKDLTSTEKFDYLLKRVRNDGQAVGKFYAYLISIDKNGLCQFYKEDIGSGNGRYSKFDPLTPPPEIVLIPDLHIDPKSLGTEILILIVTDTELFGAANMFDFSGVRGSAESATKGGGNPLTDLFNDFGMAITAKGEPTSGWSVQHLILRSVEK